VVAPYDRIYPTQVSCSMGLWFGKYFAAPSSPRNQWCSPDCLRFPKRPVISNVPLDSPSIHLWTLGSWHQYE
jgi:hypothetical protein